MSENNNSNGEIKDNKAGYEDVNRQENQFIPNNTSVNPGPNTYYNEGQMRNIQPENRIPEVNSRNYRPRENNQYNPNNRPGFNDPTYQANYNENPRNYYRGDDRMNYRNGYTNNYSMNYPNSYPVNYMNNYPNGYQNNYRDGYPNNYSTNYRDGYVNNYSMNYSNNYPNNYPSNYRAGNDYGDGYPCPNYYDDYDYDDCCEPRRPYYGGPRPYGRPRVGAWCANMRGYDPYYNYGMMPNSWWNQRMITDFINRPKVNNFFRGVGIATVGLILAPSVARTLRPIVVKAVQGVMNTSDEFRNIFADAKEDIEDIFAESKWEGSNNERYGFGENENYNKEC